jgi:hypothetical protein
MQREIKDTDALSEQMAEIAELLRKYHHPQAKVVEAIFATLRTPNPDFVRLCGIEMWGGAGAVWEVCLSSQQCEESKSDDQSVRRAFIRLAASMDKIGIGTDRSRFIASTFQKWLDKGL